MAATNGQTLTAETPELSQEPSMEDILASIRRIIATDQHIAGARALSASAAPGGGSASAPIPPVAPPSATSQAGVPDGPLAPPPPSTPIFPISLPDLDDLDPLVSPPAAIDAASGDSSTTSVAPRREPAAQLHPELFPSPAEVRDVADVYDLSLSDRVAAPEAGIEDLISSAARDQVSSSFHMLAGSMLRDPETIERMARDTLRPMLKTWLDENLPSMVERLVRAEIERVARGGRSRG